MAHSFPTHSDFLHPFLDILCKNSPITRNDMMDKMANHFGLTPADLAIRTRQGKSTLLESRINWCYQHMRWAGFMNKPTKKGVWNITPYGEKYLASHKTITIADLMEIPSFAAHKK